NNGCSTETDSLMVHLISNFYQPQITGDSTVCFGDSLTLLTDMVPEGTYQWSVNNEVLSDDPEVILSGEYTSTDLVNILLTVDVADCASGTATLNVAVLPLPPDISINGYPDVCDGDTAMLYAETPDSVNISWSWTDQELFSDTALVSESADSVLVWMTSEMNGCFQLPVEQWVTFHPFPVIASIDSNSPVCAGDLLTLNAMGSGSNSTSIHTPMGFNYSSGSMQLYPADTSNTGEYIIQVSSEFCTTYDSVWLVVNPVPDIDLGNDSIYCSGSKAYFEITDYDLVFWNDTILSNY